MMHWRTDTVRSTFNVTSNVNRMVSNRASQRGSVGNFRRDNSSSPFSFFRDSFNSFMMDYNLSQGQIIGINTDEVPRMRYAIELYCKEIEKYLKNLNPADGLNKAIKSPVVEKALLNYMNSVKSYCANLISQLRAFSDKLADVASKWNRSTEAMADSINKSSDNFATGTTYNSSGGFGSNNTTTDYRGDGKHSSIG